MEQENNQFGKKYAFYNDKYAICFQAVVSRSKFSTINIDIAPLLNRSPNWNEKTTLQLSEQDLYALFYLIANNKPLKYSSKFHGEEKNKSFKFEEDSSGECTITLSKAGKVSFFKCSPGRMFYAKLLIVEQLLGHPLSLSEARDLLPKPAVKT